jgi:predicted RNA-binding protein with PUA-like domain
MNYWLLKNEPECFSIQDLAAALNQTTCWDGVRNYQARNFLRDSLKRGDRVFYYHSNAEPSAIVGTATVVREGYPDHTAWDPRSDHFDPAASPENPIWQMVDVQLEQIFARPLTLEELRGVSELAGLELLRRGSRLSVQPVSAAHFAVILRLAQQPGPAVEAAQRQKQSVKKVAVKKASMNKGQVQKTPVKKVLKKK